MNGSDSDSECEIERLDSNPIIEFDTCPVTKTFLLKVKKENEKFKILQYSLKEGSKLPYRPEITGDFVLCGSLSLHLYILGYDLMFNKELLPVMNGIVGHKKKDKWIFDGKL